MAPLLAQMPLLDAPASSPFSVALQVEDSGIAALRRMSALTSLNLAGCVSIGEQGMALIPAQMPLLECLKLGGCSRVATITDPCLAPLQHLKALTHLDLAGCLEITDAGLCICMSSHLSQKVQSTLGLRCGCS